MLLWMLASIFALQVFAYGAGVTTCIYLGVAHLNVVADKPVCKDVSARMQVMFETATTTILALTGGAGLRKD